MLSALKEKSLRDRPLTALLTSAARSQFAKARRVLQLPNNLLQEHRWEPQELALKRKIM